jgi:hypothetical protein
MMNLTVVAQPANAMNGERYRRKYNAVLSTIIDPGHDYLHLRFVDRGSTAFTIGIMPAQFEALAKEMVKAQPEAAVKAFGAAMQGVQIPKPEFKLPSPVAPKLEFKPIPAPKAVNATQTDDTAQA